MPAKSKKQFRWAQAAYSRGEISKKVKDDYTHGVDYHKLPTRRRKHRDGADEALAHRIKQLRKKKK